MGILWRETIDEYYLKQPRLKPEDIYKETNRSLQEPSELSVALCITYAMMPANLDISKNILTARLEHLVTHGVLARVDAGVHGTRYEYELTPMGRDLATVMTALREWGDRWIYGEGREPVLALDRRSGHRIPRLRILHSDGRPLAGRDIALAPGPGASKRTRARLGAT
jgi:hypothetical protein